MNKTELEAELTKLKDKVFDLEEQVNVMKQVNNDLHSRIDDLEDELYSG